jgi:hypothetical protein
MLRSGLEVSYETTTKATRHMKLWFLRHWKTETKDIDNYEAETITKPYHYCRLKS